MEGVHEALVDNGVMFLTKWLNSGGPFRSDYGWGKGSVDEGGIREPFIISWQGKIKTGSKSDLITANWDFFPTVCELIKAKHPENIDGVSYLPTLLNRSQQQKKHTFLYWEFPGYGGQQAVRLGKWKGIIQDMNKGNTTIQLFDLDKDIQEQHDVANQNSDIVKKIAHIMKEEHRTPEVASFRMKVLDGE